MAAVEAAYSVSSHYLPSSPRLPFSSNPSSVLKLRISCSNTNLFLNSKPCILPPLPINPPRKLPRFGVSSAVQEEVAVDEKPEQETQKPDPRRKLFVLNLPWELTVDDIKKHFGECGTVTDVEIIKRVNGKSKGYVFVTMASGEEAQAVIEKFDNQELLGRVIKVELANRFKKPSPPPPPESPPPGETRHKLYVSNLPWKARSGDLREFFATFNLISAKVVFENVSGKSAGYGFVSFATREEAEAAISTLNGKELLGRPISLKFSVKNTEESTTGKEEEDKSEKPE